MGGFGSGRCGGKSLVENGLTLDLNRLLRQRLILPKQYVSRQLTWNRVPSGEKIASIGYEACLINSEVAWARLHYSANGKPQSYRVQLETTPCHYGGRRWWWICPISGRRAAKLYLPPGATIFAARAVYQLVYRSQRETEIDRSHAKQERLYQKLGGTYGSLRAAAAKEAKRHACDDV